MIERGTSSFGIKFIECAPTAYGGSLSLPPVICFSYTGRNFRALALDTVRGRFIDVISGPLDAPERLPAGSHKGENVTCNGLPIMRKAQTIYANEVQR